MLDKPQFDEYFFPTRMINSIIQEHRCKILYLSYDIVYRSKIAPCIKVYKLLVVYRFWGNVM